MPSALHQLQTRVKSAAAYDEKNSSSSSEEEDLVPKTSLQRTLQTRHHHLKKQHRQEQQISNHVFKGEHEDAEQKIKALQDSLKEYSTSNVHVNPSSNQKSLYRKSFQSIQYDMTRGYPELKRSGSEEQEDDDTSDNISYYSSENDDRMEKDEDEDEDENEDENEDDDQDDDQKEEEEEEESEVGDEPQVEEEEEPLDEANIIETPVKRSTWNHLKSLMNMDDITRYLDDVEDPSLREILIKQKIEQIANNIDQFLQFDQVIREECPSNISPDELLIKVKPMLTSHEKSAREKLNHLLLYQPSSFLEKLFLCRDQYLENIRSTIRKNLPRSGGNDQNQVDAPKKTESLPTVKITITKEKYNGSEKLINDGNDTIKIVNLDIPSSTHLYSSSTYDPSRTPRKSRRKTSSTTVPHHKGILSNKKTMKNTKPITWNEYDSYGKAIIDTSSNDLNLSEAISPVDMSSLEVVHIPDF